MPPVTLILFGNPKAGTPLMVARPTAALDLPLKAVVWEAENGGRFREFQYRWVSDRPASSSRGARGKSRAGGENDRGGAGINETYGASGTHGTYEGGKRTRTIALNCAPVLPTLAHRCDTEIYRTNQSLPRRALEPADAAALHGGHLRRHRRPDAPQADPGALQPGGGRRSAVRR